MANAKEKSMLMLLMHTTPKQILTLRKPTFSQ